MSQPNSRSFHGQKKRKSIGSKTLGVSPSAADQTIRVDAGKGDLFSVITNAAGAGAGTLILDIVSAHDGQELWIRYDANSGSDDTAPQIKLNGTATTSQPPTVTPAGEYLYVVKIFDKDDATSVSVSLETIVA